MLLQLLIVGLVLAFLRHNYRWIYYPVKWSITLLISIMLTIIGFSIFKLVFGVSEVWFSELMHNLGSSQNLFWSGIWFISIGSFVTTVLDNIISHIEQQIFCGEVYRFDKDNRPIHQPIQHVWNPSHTQSLFWNIYGLSVFTLVVYKLVTHQGTSLFNIWS